MRRAGDQLSLSFERGARGALFSLSLFSLRGAAAEKSVLGRELGVQHESPTLWRLVATAFVALFVCALRLSNARGVSKQSGISTRRHRRMRSLIHHRAKSQSPHTELQR